MSKLIYIDTNVYLDLLIGRESGLMPNNEIALNILNRALKCEFHIIISNFVLKEMEKFAKKEAIRDMLDSLFTAEKMIFEMASREDKARANLLNPDVPFGDCLHFVIAERCGAEYLVTNDKHFGRLNNKVKIIKPNLL